MPWLIGMAGGLLAAVIAGVVLFWPTPQGTVRIETDDPTVEILFDKDGPTIKGADKKPITLCAGEHIVLIQRGDFSFAVDRFVIAKGETVTLKVESLLGRMQLVQDGRVLGSRSIPLPPTLTNSLGMKFALIPAGTFMMGSSAEEIAHWLKLRPDQAWKELVKAEGPEHEVDITQPFYMGVHEVTFGQYRQFVNENRYPGGGGGMGGDHPVVFVTWQNAVDFCAWLSKKEDRKYRLPTEAEWEYCCRAGKSGTRYCFGNVDSELDLYAWHSGEKPRMVRTFPVGMKKENAWGLHDMHGNVWEWCQDWYDATYYKRSPKQNPQGPSTGKDRVQRGGSQWEDASHQRSAHRIHSAPSFRYNNMGFRVVLVVSSPDGVRP